MMRTMVGRAAAPSNSAARRARTAAGGHKTKRKLCRVHAPDFRACGFPRSRGRLMQRGGCRHAALSQSKMVHSPSEIHMQAVLDPLVSEFDTEEQALDHDRWFRAKVQEAVESKKPRLPHDEAMARVNMLLQERRKQRAVG